MKIPRRLKEILSTHGDNLSVEQEKRGFVLVHGSDRMPIDLGQVVTLDQWDTLARQISKFAKGTRWA